MKEQKVDDNMNENIKDPVQNCHNEINDRTEKRCSC